MLPAFPWPQTSDAAADEHEDVRIGNSEHALQRASLLDCYTKKSTGDRQTKQAAGRGYRPKLRFGRRADAISRR